MRAARIVHRELRIDSRECVYNASRLKRRIHRAVIGFLIRSKAPIVSSCARESKIDESNSLFSNRANPPRFASECRSLSCKWTFKVSRARARSIFAAENRLCAPYGLHHAALSVRNCDCKVASETHRPLSIINLVRKPIRIRRNRFNLEIAFCDVRSQNWFSDKHFSIYQLFYTERDDFAEIS